MRILVTGGAGFIGSHLCEALLALNERVICVDNFNNYYDPRMKEKNSAGFADHPNVRVCRADIEDHASLKKIFDEEHPEKIVHLAARAGVRASIEKPLDYGQTNITGLLHLLELSREYKIKKFVFCSSSSVYGDRNVVPFREADDVNHPISPYAATKRAGELLCYTYNHLFKIPIVCLRLFTVYGPRGRPDMAPYKFIKAIMEGRPIEVYGDGTTLRDYTYVEDIVAGILAGLEKELQYEIINLGHSHPMLLHEFISVIERVVGKKAIMERKPMQPGDVSRTYADITKAKALLGWVPRVTIEEGVRRTYEYFLTSKILIDGEKGLING